jgi:hypothetical protein
MATSTEASSSSRAPTKTPAHKQEESLATFPGAEVARENTGDAAAAPDIDAATGAPDNSAPSAVKRYHLIQRIKTWSPVLILENSGSVGRYPFCLELSG